jgi:hypothetical protein
MICRRNGMDGSGLDSTMVGGQASMRHGEWLEPDESVIMDQACKTASRLWQRI